MSKLFKNEMSNTSIYGLCAIILTIGTYFTQDSTDLYIICVYTYYIIQG